ncbi:hypothetical protein CCUS01_00628 [Colletotrichum cuscutae]|uniref:Uncharacterized protein n=1 Tax=Colletotrichum cuscutae TaxID=1209917 RepID=A0AAI9VCS5_9PEZI|nr:hypothetical protein CCUS01_00628 [Colletotrichum cuscutae]
MTITSLQELRKQATPSVELKRIKHNWLNLIPWDARGTDNDAAQSPKEQAMAVCACFSLDYVRMSYLFRGVQRVKDHPEFPLYASFQAGECDEAQWPGDWNQSNGIDFLAMTERNRPPID